MVSKIVKESGLHTKVIIGGAVITQSFADEIQADGYSRDAQEAMHTSLFLPIRTV